MKRILKFPLDGFRERQLISAPGGPKPLSVQIQGGEVTMWAEVDTGEPIQAIAVSIAGSGHDVPDGEFLGTVQDGVYVWHVYVEHRTGRAT